MKSRIGSFLLGVVLFALMAPTSNVPSRPKFSAVGVGVPAPSANGRILANAEVITNSQFYTGVAGSGTGGAVRFISDDGVTRWYAGVLGTASNKVWSLYDIINGREVFKADPTTGAVTLSFAAATNGFTVADGTVTGVIGTGGTQLNFGTTSNHSVAIASNGATRLTIPNTGGLQISAPVSGTALTVNGSILATGLSSSTLTSGNDTALRLDVPSVDAFYIGSNNSGVANAVGAANGVDYIYTNQNRAIVIGTQSLARLTIAGDGVATLNGNTLFGQASGTFTANLTTACTTTPAPTFKYKLDGNVVTLRMDANVSCTSDSTITAVDAASLPAAIRPAANICVQPITATDNTTTNSFAAVRIQADGGINFQFGGGTGCSGASWTAAGTKSLSQFTVTYLID